MSEFKTEEKLQHPIYKWEKNFNTSFSSQKKAHLQIIPWPPPPVINDHSLNILSFMYLFIYLFIYLSYFVQICNLSSIICHIFVIMLWCRSLHLWVICICERSWYVASLMCFTTWWCRTLMLNSHNNYVYYADMFREHTIIVIFNSST